MIVRLLTFLFLGILLWLIWHWKHSDGPEQRRKLVLNAMFWGLILVVIALAATGRIHWLGAAFAGILVGIKQLSILAFRLFPTLAQIYGRHQASQSSQSGGSTPPSSSAMSESEARQILGVEPDADIDDIKRAHRAQMSKQHPDHGGNAYFAAKLNQARDVLTAKIKNKKSS